MKTAAGSVTPAPVYAGGPTAAEIFAEKLWRELSDAGCKGFAVDDRDRRRVPASVTNGTQMQGLLATAPARNALRESSLSSSPFSQDEEFERAFAPDQIISVLARLRIKCASKGREAALLQRLFHGFKAGHGRGEIDRLYPPRRQWQHHRPYRNRKHRGSTLTSVALRNAMLEGFRKPAADRPDWAQRLHDFVKVVRLRVLDADSISFSKPKIVGIFDGGSKQRLIALFPLEDRIIDKLVSKYLRVRFDALFSSSAFAYRAASTREAQPTQHEIIRRLQALFLQHPDRGYWIAGCDLRKCFDCFPHALARAAFRAASETTAVLNAPVDPRAARVYEAYLDCYDYRSAIHDNTDAHHRRFRRNTESGWPVAELRALHGGSFETQRIGVPQGMALSMLTSNLLLSALDFEVTNFRYARPITAHYFRYSDDARFIADQEEECRAMLRVFVAAATRLKLPVHPPTDECSADTKSTKPRRLEGKPPGAHVGYTFWSDGQVAIRPSSLKKHQAKRWKLIATINACLKRYPLKSSPEQLLKSVGARLMRMSVPTVGRGYCWANGFRIAKGGGREVETQARNLDRLHGSQLAALVRALEKRFGCKVARPYAPRRNHFRTYFNAFKD